MQPCRLLLLLGLALLLLLSPAASEDFTCTSDRQVVNCGQLPVDTAEQQAEYIACCRANIVTPAAAAEEVRVAAAAAGVRQALQPAQMRPDLDPSGPLNTTLNFRWGLCHTRRRAIIPTFSGTSWTTTRQTVRLPATLVQDDSSGPDLAAPAMLASAGTVHHSSL
jgi:hypothetical protein